MPNPTTDFSIFDNQELVTYTPVSSDAVDNIRAVRRPLTQSGQRNVERYFELQFSDVVFHLDGAPLAGVLLQTNDRMTDAHSQMYSVLFFERQVLSNTVVVVGRPFE